MKLVVLVLVLVQVGGWGDSGENVSQYCLPVLHKYRAYRLLDTYVLPINTRLKIKHQQLLRCLLF